MNPTSQDSVDFHSQNIDKLVEYWLEVVNNEGEYITDRFVEIVNRIKINGKRISSNPI